MVGLEKPCKVRPMSLALGWVGSGRNVPAEGGAVLYGACQPGADEKRQQS